jgi:hypothetical protein
MANQVTNKEGFLYISDVVRSFLADRGSNVLHGYIRFLKWAIDGYREINYGIALNPATVTCKVDDLKRVNVSSLPGFRILSKIGVRVGDRIHAFLPDASISKLFEKRDDGSNIPNKSYIDTLKGIAVGLSVYPVPSGHNMTKDHFVVKELVDFINKFKQLLKQAQITPDYSHAPKA